MPPSQTACRVHALRLLRAMRPQQLPALPHPLELLQFLLRKIW